MAGNPLLFFQIAATVIPALFIAVAVTLRAFSPAEGDDSPLKALVDALGVLCLAAGEATALRAIKIGQPTAAARSVVSSTLLLALLVLVLELAGPRIATTFRLLGRYSSDAPQRKRRVRGVIGLIALVSCSGMFLFMLAAMALLLT